MALKILILSHDDCLGAPGLLVSLANALRQKEFDFKFIFLEKADVLWRDFQALGETLAYPKAPVRGPFLKIRRRIRRLAGERLLRGVILNWRPALVLMNTVASAHLLGFLSQLGVPVVVYVHELQGVYDYFAKSYEAQFLSVPKHYLACSEAVRRFLTAGLSIDSAKVSLVSTAIDFNRIDRLVSEPVPEGFVNLRKGFDYIVGACGMTERRKGTDLWLHIAAAVKKNIYPKTVRFVWVGAKPTKEHCGELYQFATEIEQLGLGEEVLFTGILTNPYPIFKQLDVFVLPSREDACPQAVLENLYLSKPVICFEGCGGAPEIVRHDAGYVVRDLNIGTVAEKIISLLRSPADRSRFGEIGRARIIELFDMTKVSIQAAETLRELC